MTMPFNKREKAILEANALIGYCRSASWVRSAPKERLEAWLDGLEKMANQCADAIDQSHGN